MSMLTQDELTTIASKALKAAAFNDDDGVIAAMKPLWRPTGDMGDGYLFTSLMVQVVLNSLPHAECPEHGTQCLTLGFGLVGVGPDGQPNWSDTTGLGDFEELYPAHAAYLQMMTAEYRGDVDATIEIFCTAAQAGHAPDLVWTAVRNAGQVLKHHLASLQ